MTTTATQYPCPKCRGALAWVSERSQGGSGCLLIVIGLGATGLGLIDAVAPALFDKMGGGFLEMLYGLQ